MDKDTFFIADFYCSEHRLVVEIDGKSHVYQKEYDVLRTEIINNMDMNVIRFRNEEIEQDLQGVLTKLEKIIQDGTHSVAPLSLEGVSEASAPLL